MCLRLCSGVNELNNAGETPLHVACRLGRMESVKALLGGGARCDVIGGAGYPIHSAMKYSEKGWVWLQMSVEALSCCLWFLAWCLMVAEGLCRGFKYILHHHPYVLN